MMGKAKRIAELEEQLRKVQESLDRTGGLFDERNREIAELQDKVNELQAAASECDIKDGRIRELEEMLQTGDSELKKCADERDRAVRALDEKLGYYERAEKEYRDLKEIYQKKIIDFEEKKDEQERLLVHEAAVARAELSDEIAIKKQESIDQIKAKLSIFIENYEKCFSHITRYVQSLNDAAESSCRAYLSSDDMHDFSEYFEQTFEKLSGYDETFDSDIAMLSASETAPEESAPSDDVPSADIPPEDIVKAVSSIRIAIDDLDAPYEE